jgi:hypothetical protein
VSIRARTGQAALRLDRQGTGLHRLVSISAAGVRFKPLNVHCQVFSAVNSEIVIQWRLAVVLS